MSAAAPGNPGKPQTLKVLADGIPPALKLRPQWLCWRWAFIPDKKKWTKVPHQTNGNKAAVNKPSTWTTFDQAFTAYERGKFDGIGFVLTADDEYTGIDFDHVRDANSGFIEAMANQWITEFNTYAEASPTGSGVHLWLIGKLPGIVRHKVDPIEIYDRLRYFTVTGHHLPPSPITIEPRQPAIDRLLATHFAPKPKPQPRRATASATLDFSDDKVLERAAQSPWAARFKQLYHMGAGGADDCSKLDFELACILLRIGHGDLAQCERLLWSSALRRDKWEELRGAQTYLGLTIDHAAAEVGGDYYRAKD